MNKFFLSILHSWGSDTPSEVFWALNDLLTWAKTKGFKSEDIFEDPLELYDREEEIHTTNERLVKELSEWFETIN